MSIPARTGADPVALERFADRAVGAKLVELADRTRDLLAGHLRYDGVDLASIRRIFPVLVLAGDTLPQTPLLWGHLRAIAPTAFVDDARMQDPVICDLDDLEPLLALAEGGHHFPDILAEFRESDVGEFSPRNWLAQTHGLDRRPSYVDQQYRAASNLVQQRMFPGSKPLPEGSG
ncbi:MAG: hypothetical protein JWQ18_87 [Conexibacter sp.]|nr:hypothetical protein [Conexibacter sp.]